MALPTKPPAGDPDVPETSGGEAASPAQEADRYAQLSQRLDVLLHEVSLLRRDLATLRPEPVEVPAEAGAEDAAEPAQPDHESSIPSAAAASGQRTLDEGRTVQPEPPREEDFAQEPPSAQAPAAISAEAGSLQLGPAAADPPPEPARPAAADDLETRIGTVWFLRGGLVILIIGFALFARALVLEVGAGTRVGLSFLGAALLYALGRHLDERLQAFARPLMAGGLALAFFTSFAAHFIGPMRCLPLSVSLLLMFASVGAVLWRAEVWRSESTAALALLLGHVAAYVGSVRLDTLEGVALVVLSLTALVLVVRHDWLMLAFFALCSAFISQFLWALRDSELASRPDRFAINLAFLTAYYLIFLAADLLFYERLFQRGPDAFTQRQRLAGRTLGTTVLPAYATFAAALFHVTEVYWGKIDVFFFLLAAVQLVLVWLRRRRGGQDRTFYGVAAVVFLILGLFSALGGLALSMTLASLALLLLLLARRIDFWFLRPLAQGVLAVNFIHFWFSDAKDLNSWPDFAGAVLMASIYFVKARLSETWRPIPDEWRFGKGRRRGFWKAFYRRFGKPISHWQALAGAVLMSYQCGKFLPAPWDALAVAGMAVLFFVPGVRLGSAAVLQGVVLLEAGVVWWLGRQALAAGPSLPAAVVPDSWLASSVAAGLLAATGLVAVLVAPRRRRRTYVRFATAALSFSLLAAALAAYGLTAAPAPGAAAPPWWAALLVVPVLVWAAVDRWPVPSAEALAAGLTPRLVRFYRGARWRRLVLAGGAGLLPAWIVGCALRDGHAAVLVLTVAIPVLAAMTLWRQSPHLLLATLIHQAITGVLALVALEAGDPLRWWIVTAAAALALVLVGFCPVCRRGSFAVGALVSSIQALGLLGVLTLLPDEPFIPPWPWLLPAALLLVALEVFRSSRARDREFLRCWQDRWGEPLLLELARLPAGLGAVVTSAVLGLVAERGFPLPEHALWTMAATSAVLLAATLWRASPYLLAALLTHLGLMTAHRLLHGRRLVVEPLLEWVTVTLIVVAAAALLYAAPRCRRGSFGWGGLAAMALGQVALGELFINGRPGPPSALWIATFAVLWLGVEFFYRGFYGRSLPRDAHGDEALWHDTHSTDFLIRRAMGLGVVVSMAGAVLLIALTFRQFPSPVVMICVTLLYAVLFVVLTAVLKSPPMAAAFAVCLTAVHPLFYLRLGPERAAGEAAPLTFLVLLVTFLAGIASEWSFLSHEVPGRRRPAWWGAWYPYLLGFTLGGLFLEAYGARVMGAPAWGAAWQMVLALAAFAVSRRRHLRWLTRAGFVYALVVLGLFGWRAGMRPDWQVELLPVGLLIFVQLLLMERIVASQDPMSLSRRSPKTAVFYGRALIAAAALVLMGSLSLSTEVRGYWTTAGWSLLALVLMAAGFLWRRRAYRRTALVIFALAVLRLFVVDAAGLETVYRILAFVCLGLSMIAVSYLYNRYRETINRWL